MAEVTRTTQAGKVLVGSGDPAIRTTQAGKVLVGSGDPAIRTTQAGKVVVAAFPAGVHVTQAGKVLTVTSPVPWIRATALDKTRIQLDMTGSDGGTEHHLYRSLSPEPAAIPTNLIASWVGDPPATLIDTDLPAGTAHYYRLVGVVDGVEFSAWAGATTDGLSPPKLTVGAVGAITAKLSVPSLSAYLEVEYLTHNADGDTVDSGSQTGTLRWVRDLSGLTPETTYTSWARVRYADGWSEWSDSVEWTTRAVDYSDSDAMACPPVWSGIHHNPDGNPWNRLGRGFFRPLPGMPLRGTEAEIIFRWQTSGPTLAFDLSDDLGATWSEIATDVAATGSADGDRLIPYRITLDTTGYADGMDYRLRARFLDGEADNWESMSFAIDNAEEVHWWKAQFGYPETGKWGKMWAQKVQKFSGAETSELLWGRGVIDGGLAALKGHDFTMLVDREIPESYGADVTVRYYLWSGEGGLFRLQGRDDIEYLKVGVSFFAKGTSRTTMQGLFVGMANANSWPLGCCTSYLTSASFRPEIWYRQTPGTSLLGRTFPDTDPSEPLPKVWARAMKKPWQWEAECARFPQYVPPGMGMPCDAPWPYMTWRNGPEPGVGIDMAKDTCARRWEMYSQRTRVEVDPLDFKRVRLRARWDGPGVAEPSTGYWHVDEWLEFAEEWERGTTGFCSQQIAQQLYGSPNGARVFYSLSVLPLEPGEPPEIPPLEEAEIIEKAWAFVLDGHIFYVLSRADAPALICDLRTGQWYEWFTGDGESFVDDHHWNMFRGIMWKGRVIAADISDSVVWELDPHSFLDEVMPDVEEYVQNGYQIARAVTAYQAHRGSESKRQGSMRLTARNEEHDEDIWITMRFSDDGGRTWSRNFTVVLGAGDYSKRIEYRSLGRIRAPGRIWEIEDAGGLVRIEGVDSDTEGEE